MRQFIKFFGESKVSIALNIVLLCSFFGFMHGYQGITGQLVTTIAVHGFFNTLAVICVYFDVFL